jgi:hypothetical protein
MKLYYPGCIDNNKQIPMELYSPGCMENNKQMKLYYPGCMENKTNEAVLPWVYRQ